MIDGVEVQPGSKQPCTAGHDDVANAGPLLRVEGQAIQGATQEARSKRLKKLHTLR